jgi:hypothetical protein
LICNFPTPQFPKDPIALIPFLTDSYRIHWVVGEVSRWVIANRLILNAKWRFVSRGPPHYGQRRNDGVAQDRIGSIEKGKFADMVAVSGNPLTDITELQRMKFVMKGGRVVKNEIATGATMGVSPH